MHRPVERNLGTNESVHLGEEKATEKKTLILGRVKCTPRGQAILSYLNKDTQITLLKSGLPWAASGARLNNFVEIRIARGTCVDFIGDRI